jgi:glycine/D-amino acid oxidase-like deaminating enzyme
VAVIGAGVSGLSAAGTAAAAGARTVLLERGKQAASGASGKNAGIVCMGANLLRCELGDDSSSDWLWKQTTELGRELYEAARLPNALLRAQNVGSLTLAVQAEDAEHFADEVKCRQAMGLAAEVITAEEAARKTGRRLSVEGVQSVLWLPDEGRGHPWTLCAHLTEKARKAGATMYGGAHVTSWKPDGSRWAIELENGTKVLAGALIQCTGPTVDTNKRIYAMAFETTLPDDFPVFQDAAPFTYFDYRTGDGHIVCTGGPYATAGDVAADAPHLAAMADTVHRWIPELRDASPKYTWAVDLKVTPEMLPQIKILNDEPHAVSIIGLGALGVLPGILLGRQAAQSMVTKK